MRNRLLESGSKGRSVVPTPFLGDRTIIDGSAEIVA